MDLPTIYRAYVIELAVSLDLIVARASDALRVIPDRVVIRYDHAAREHSIEIEGSLASILGLGRRGAPTHLDGRPPHGGGSGRRRAPGTGNDNNPHRRRGLGSIRICDVSLGLFAFSHSFASFGCGGRIWSLVAVGTSEQSASDTSVTYAVGRSGSRR